MSKFKVGDYIIAKDTKLVGIYIGIITKIEDKYGLPKPKDKNLLNEQSWKDSVVGKKYFVETIVHSPKVPKIDALFYFDIVIYQLFKKLNISNIKLLNLLYRKN